MSIGVGGRSRIVRQDAEAVVYEYAPYDLNDERGRNPDIVYDGLITISQAALTEPEIHEIVKKMPGGRKQLVVKRIPREVDFEACIETGLITVSNSSFCRHVLSNGIDMIAAHLISDIIRRYQQEGVLPETVSYHV